MKKFFIVIAFTTTLLVNISHSRELTAKPTYLNLDLGYSKSLDMKGTYNSNMRASSLLGVGVSLDLLPHINLGFNVAHRNSFMHELVHLDETVVGIYKQPISISTGMINATYKATSINDMIHPYINIGIGVSRIQAKELSVRVKESSGEDETHKFNGGVLYKPAYSLGIGASAKITKRLFLDAGYRFVHFGKIDVTNYNMDDDLKSTKYTGKLRSNEVIVSLRYML